MEHAEIISKSFSDLKTTLFGFANAGRWVKLFLLIVIPGIIGFILASILFQAILKPLLMPVLVESGRYGFTEGGLTYMLEYLAGIIGFLFVFVIPLFQGYLYRTIRSDAIPSTRNIFGLFISGWRMNLVMLFYAIPMIIISVVYAVLYRTLAGNVSNMITMVAINDGVQTGVFILYLVLQFITFIIVSIFAIISLVHVSRGGSFKDAFRFRKIRGIIRHIGWYNYLLCLVSCTILLLIIIVLFLGFGLGFAGSIPALVIIVALFLVFLIPVLILITRYVTRVYDVGMLPEEEDTEDFDNF